MLLVVFLEVTGSLCSCLKKYCECPRLRNHCQCCLDSITRNSPVVEEVGFITCGSQNNYSVRICQEGFIMGLGFVLDVSRES